jgi:hypothetical protein
MEAAKSIVSLFKIVEEISGSTEAKNTVSDTLFIVIDNLLSEGLPITEENINSKLQKYAEEFAEASKSDVA